MSRPAPKPPVARPVRTTLLVLIPVAVVAIVLYVLLSAIFRVAILVLATVGLVALFDAKGVLRYPGLAWRRLCRGVVLLAAAWPFRLATGRRPAARARGAARRRSPGVPHEI